MVSSLWIKLLFDIGKSAKTGFFTESISSLAETLLTPVIVGSNGNLMFPAPGSYRKITILAGMGSALPIWLFFLRSCVPPENLFSESLTHMGKKSLRLVLERLRQCDRIREISLLFL